MLNAKQYLKMFLFLLVLAYSNPSWGSFCNYKFNPGESQAAECYADWCYQNGNGESVCVGVNMCDRHESLTQVIDDSDTMKQCDDGRFQPMAPVTSTDDSPLA